METVITVWAIGLIVLCMALLTVLLVTMIIIFIMEIFN